MDESLNNLVEGYLQTKETKPSFIVLGMASAYLQKNTTREALESFKSNLTNLIDLVKSLDYDTKFPHANKRIYKLDKSTSQMRVKANRQPDEAASSQATSIYWMLQDPIDESKFFTNRTISQHETMNNRQIDVYNRAAINLLYVT